MARIAEEREREAQLARDIQFAKQLQEEEDRLAQQPKARSSSSTRLKMPKVLPNKIKELISAAHDHGITLSEKQLKYNPLSPVTDVGYMYLMDKYKSKCFMEGTLIMDASKQFKFMNMFGDVISLTVNLKKCIQKNTGVILIPLRIPVGVATHANAIIYRPFMKRFERYEPHGVGNTWVDKHLRAYLKSLERELPTEFTPIQYAAPIDVSKIDGFQIFEGKMKSFDIEGGGYCQMWSLLVMEAILKNPTLSTADIVAEIYQIAKDDPVYFKNLIRGYTSLLFQEILKHTKSDIDLKEFTFQNTHFHMYKGLTQADARVNTSDQREIVEPESLKTSDEHKQVELVDSMSDAEVYEYFNAYLKLINTGYDLHPKEYHTKDYLLNYLRDKKEFDFVKKARTFMDSNKRELRIFLDSLNAQNFKEIFQFCFPSKTLGNRQTDLMNTLEYLRHNYTVPQFYFKYYLTDADVVEYFNCYLKLIDSGFDFHKKHFHTKAVLEEYLTIIGISLPDFIKRAKHYIEFHKHVIELELAKLTPAKAKAAFHVCFPTKQPPADIQSAFPNMVEFIRHNYAWDQFKLKF